MLQIIVEHSNLLSLNVSIEQFLNVSI
jgi:hypothetical protein